MRRRRSVRGQIPIGEPRIRSFRHRIFKRAKARRRCRTLYDFRKILSAHGKSPPGSSGFLCVFQKNDRRIVQNLTYAFEKKVYGKRQCGIFIKTKKRRIRRRKRFARIFGFSYDKIYYVRVPLVGSRKILIIFTLFCGIE